MTYANVLDYLVREQGISPQLLQSLKERGFQHTTMICPSINEQIDYERQLRKQYRTQDIAIIDLSKGGKAYFVRHSDH